jgi:hypothetical protein
MPDLKLPTQVVKDISGRGSQNREKSKGKQKETVDVDSD